MEWLLTAVERFPYGGIVLLLLLGGVGLPVPEEVTLIFSGFLMGHGIIRPVPAILVILPALWTADVILYSIGKRYGRSIVTHRRFRKILSEKRLAWLEAKFHAGGFLFILIGRQLMGLRAQVILAAGVTRLPLRRFVFYDMLASGLTVAIMTGIGALGGRSLGVLVRDVSRVEHLIIAGGVGLAAVFLLVRFLRAWLRGSDDGTGRGS
jgi:membrane protein DedA with SNARE-associated domain